MIVDGRIRETEDWIAYCRSILGYIKDHASELLPMSDERLSAKLTEKGLGVVPSTVSWWEDKDKQAAWLWANGLSEKKPGIVRMCEEYHPKQDKPDAQSL